MTTTSIRTARSPGIRAGQGIVVLLLATAAIAGLLISAVCFPVTLWLGWRCEAYGRRSQHRAVRWHTSLVTVWGASCAVLLEFPRALKYAVQRYD